jgi:hypothetical protein
MPERPHVPFTVAINPIQPRLIETDPYVASSRFACQFDARVADGGVH